MDQFIKFAGYLSWFSVLVPLSFFFFRKESLTTPFFKLLLSYLLIALLSDSLSYYFAISGWSSIIIYNFFHLFQFILITLLFVSIMRPWKIFMIVMCFIYTGCFFLISSFEKPLTEYQLLMFRIADVFLLLFSARYSYTVLRFRRMPAPYSYSTKWVVIMVQLYFGCNIVLLGLYAQTFDEVHPSNGMWIWFSHNVNNIVKNGLLATAIYHFNVEHVKWGLYRPPVKGDLI